MSYIGNNNLSKKWSFVNEIHHRNYNFAGDLEQLLIRTGIGYNFSQTSNFLAGYGFINTGKYDSINHKSYFNEHRLFLQYTSSTRFNRFYLDQRNRIEERFKQNHFSFRIRYFSQIICPLNKKNLDKNTFYLMAYNELFINFKAPRFDRNRLGAAVGFCFNKDLRIELGIMNQTLETKQRAQFQLVFYNTMDFL